MKTNIDKIYEEYYQKVFAYINSRINNYYQAEDLCEDVFTKVVKRIDTFDESKSSLSTWIYNICKNTLIDYYRTRHDEYELIDNYEYLEDTKPVSSAEVADLTKALDGLPQEEKDIIVLKYYEGYSLKEIAEKMSLSYGVVKLRHNDALEKMKELLAYEQ